MSGSNYLLALSFPNSIPRHTFALPEVYSKILDLRASCFLILLFDCFPHGSGSGTTTPLSTSASSDAGSLAYEGMPE